MSFKETVNLNPDYPDVLKRYRQRRNESEILFPIFDKFAEHPDFQSLKSAKKVLCIGPGNGEFDLEFIERCIPNVETIVGVEFNDGCIEEFKKNCSTRFHDQIKLTVHKSFIQDWMDPSLSSEKYDVIIGFHVFYEMMPDARIKVFSEIFNNWLNDSTGTFIFNSLTDEHISGKCNIIYQCKNYLPFKENSNTFDFAQNMPSEIEDCGGYIAYTTDYICDIDYRVYDFDLVPLFQYYCPETTEEITKTMLKETLDGFGCLSVGLHIACKK